MKSLDESTCQQCEALQDELDDLRTETTIEYRKVCDEHAKEQEELADKLIEEQDRNESLDSELKQALHERDLLLDGLETAAETVMMRAGLPRKDIDDVINRHKSRKTIKDMLTLFDEALEVADQFEMIRNEIDEAGL
jgi:phage shock protein A